MDDFGDQNHSNRFVSPGLALSVLDFAHLDPSLSLRCAVRVGLASAVLSSPGGMFGGRLNRWKFKGWRPDMSQDFVFLWPRWENQVENVRLRAGVEKSGISL